MRNGASMTITGYMVDIIRYKIYNQEVVEERLPMLWTVGTEQKNVKFTAVILPFCKFYSFKKLTRGQDF